MMQKNIFFPILILFTCSLEKMIYRYVCEMQDLVFIKYICEYLFIKYLCEFLFIKHLCEYLLSITHMIGFTVTPIY